MLIIFKAFMWGFVGSSTVCDLLLQKEPLHTFCFRAVTRERVAVILGLAQWVRKVGGLMSRTFRDTRCGCESLYLRQIGVDHVKGKGKLRRNSGHVRRF